MSFDFDIPKITVENDSMIQVVSSDNAGGRLGVIADLGFNSTDIIIAKDYRDFLSNIPASALENPTLDLKSFEQFFKQKEDSLGASYVTVAPVGSSYTVASFGNALDKLQDEDFDILVVLKPIEYVDTTIESVEIKDTYLTMLKNWLKARYEVKNGVGAIFGLRESNETGKDIITRMKDFGRGCYACIFQEINGMTLNETIGFISGTIAGRNLNKSLTSKVVSEMESITDENGINKEVLFSDENSKGKQYMNNGIMVFRVFNRRKGEFGVLRSVCPTGYDLAIERSADYMTREFQLKDYLGDSNNVVTLNGISAEINSRKYDFINTMNLCKDIITTITKVNHHTVEVLIEYVFDGIIDWIKVSIKYTLNDGDE